jgi:peptide/nickel transport system ATP-binding protein
MTDVVLHGAGLVKEYLPRGGGVFARRQPVRVVDGVDLALRSGEAVALVGESGAGKTTVGRMLARLEPATRGVIGLRGQDVTRARGRALRDFRRQVQIVFQNPYESLDPRHTIGTAVSEPLDINRVGTRAGRRHRTGELLEIVGLTPPGRFLDSLPHELSGGQRQRVAIARALALEPSVLIADEPVSMLDASIRSSILNLLTDLRTELGVAILFVTHDLAIARFMSERIAVMRDGRVVETGDTDAVLTTPEHPYTRLLLAAARGEAVTDQRQEAV